MRKTIFVVVLLLLFSLLFQGVGLMAGESSQDSVKIVRVTPSSAEINEAAEFTVVVEYNLASRDEGILYIGFNSLFVSSYNLESTNFIVKKGSGTKTFVVYKVVIDWGEEGDFGIYVNLSPYPHERQWTPLASEIYVVETYDSSTPIDTDLPSVNIPYDNFELSIGGKNRVYYEIYPEDLDNQVLLWESSDTTIATVDSTGEVTGRKAGLAYITAYTSDGLYSNPCKVSVRNELILSRKMYAIASPHLNIRDVPNGKDIGDIPYGAEVSVTEIGDELVGNYIWAKVEYSGLTGWVAYIFLSEEKIESGASSLSGDKSDWGFPVLNKSKVYYKSYSGFGASRDDGERAHAGQDFRTDTNETVVAVADGTVTRYADFYSGTYALEVQCGDGTIIRYCEIEKAAGIAKGSVVTKGQVIGKIIPNEKYETRMLHLEIYEGDSSGSLTQRENTYYKHVTKRNYERRSDLLDPTFVKSLK